ncbi:hypothetical protein F5Y11DRAFT_326218 [Daldinia sp. FL1419]|nr:hypothetical protein F5Y11DRAFT_326218 [Daldinia sp. FL1419]
MKSLFTNHCYLKALSRNFTSKRSLHISGITHRNLQSNMTKIEKPEEGDKVSWNWGGGAPGGTVAETKEKGAIEINTQRGNTVKRKADADNPAVRIERSGNDVVKRASELNIEEKNKGRRGSTKRKANNQDPEKDNNDREDEDEDEDTDPTSYGTDEEPHTENKQGKEVKKGGKEANKKQKRAQQDVSGKENEDGGSGQKTEENQEYQEESEESEESEEDASADGEVESEKRVDDDLEGNSNGVREESSSASKTSGDTKKDNSEHQVEKPKTRSQD